MVTFLIITMEPNPMSYLPFRSQILTMDLVPPLDRIYQLVVQEENQRLATTEYVKTSKSVKLAAPAGLSQ
ncbi:hypothetical protein NL676_031204 [Syzygium grande]|nr:hypothetical protein NL676_031204 [Syzygium grande]